MRGVGPHRDLWAPWSEGEHDARAGEWQDAGSLGGLVVLLRNHPLQEASVLSPARREEMSWASPLPRDLLAARAHDPARVRVTQSRLAVPPRDGWARSSLLLWASHRPKSRS